MKKTTGILLALSFGLFACNNTASDSVDKADSTNQVKIDASKDSSANPTPTIQADETTSSFMVKAADGGMTEVKLGQLAQEKGMNQGVKTFGSMMVSDHTAVNDQLKALATQRNVTLPSAISDKHQKMYDDLSKKSGKDFDKAYMDAMVKDHKADISEFKDASSNVKDNDVKMFVDNTLPKLNMHLDSAQAVQKRIK